MICFMLKGPLHKWHDAYFPQPGIESAILDSAAEVSITQT